MSKYTKLSCFSLLALFLVFCSTGHGSLSDQVVQTKYGRLRGALNESGTVTAYKGIPYAAPPVGELRWKKPQPPLPWDGIRDATRFCSSCIQNRIFTHLPHGPWTEEFMVQDSVSEDCLFLNIWTPAKTIGDRLPVMVYIHGGAFTEGSGSIDTYDGEELAKKGIIAITINYRLGVLGFLAHPELSAESPDHVSGNYGILDQLAALEWIKENISAFGGDPERVTIAGQSAGASSVTVLMISPLSKGLFSGAITQSGSSFAGMWGGPESLEEGEKRGVEFMKARGASSIAGLRAVPPMDLIKRLPGENNFRFGLVLDGRLLTGGVMKIFEEGKQNDVPFMTGMNADETGYRGSTGDDFRAFFPFTSKDEAMAAVKLAGQQQSRLDTWLWLEFMAKSSKSKSYEYYFDRAIPWPEHPEFGAFHTGEVPYVFNTISKLRGHKLEQADTLVADRMSSYWVNFVRTGDPNGPGLPHWEPFNAGKPEVMELGEKMGMIPVAASDSIFNYLKGQLLAPGEEDK